MWNIKALALSVQKLLARLKFKRGGQNVIIIDWQNDRQDKNNIPPPPRSSISGAWKLEFDKQELYDYQILLHKNITNNMFQRKIKRSICLSKYSV